MASTSVQVVGSPEGGRGGTEDGEIEEGNSRKLVVVPVVLSESWTGAEGAVPKEVKSKAVRYQRGLGKQGGTPVSGGGGVSPAEGHHREKPTGREESSGGNGGAGKPRGKGMGGGRRGKMVGPEPVGLVGVGSAPGLSSPPKAILSGPRGVTGGTGKGSPVQANPKGPRACSVGPGGSGGPRGAIGGQEGGEDLGSVNRPVGEAEGGGQNGGPSASPKMKGVARGSPRVVREKEEVLGGQGAREGRGKGRLGKGQTGTSGGALEMESPARRERTRSPVKGRGGGIGGMATVSGHRGKQIRQPQFSHGNLVTRIQHAVTQLADDDVAEAMMRSSEEGVRGQASPGKPCDK